MILLRHQIRKDPDSPIHTLRIYLFFSTLESGFKIIWIHPSTRYRIVAHLFFPLWRADLKISGFAVRFAGCVWTVAS